jgi:hypothetical protein
MAGEIDPKDVTDPDEEETRPAESMFTPARVVDL